ncbi:hypothetical protein DFH06DRAFT_728158 [Mycena polygramma]|nr:hypothetical protein DFH06DRAFT_728158 [Mycena polygramma]
MKPLWGAFSFKSYALFAWIAISATPHGVLGIVASSARKRAQLRRQGLKPRILGNCGMAIVSFPEVFWTRREPRESMDCALFTAGDRVHGTPKAGVSLEEESTRQCDTKGAVAMLRLTRAPLVLPPKYCSARTYTFSRRAMWLTHCCRARACVCSAPSFCCPWTALRARVRVRVLTRRFPERRGKVLLLSGALSSTTPKDKE